MATACNGNTCPVCLKHLASRKTTRELGKPGSCDHLFCFSCIFEWSKNVNTCPVDRLKFTNIEVYSSISSTPVRKVTVPNVVLRKANDDNTYCEICHRCTREDRLLLCDGCDKGYHMDCLTPSLDEIPSGDWYCESCDRIVQSQYTLALSSTEDDSDFNIHSRQFELDLSSDVDITGSDSSSCSSAIIVSDSDSSYNTLQEFSLDTMSMSSDGSYLEIVDFDENYDTTASERLLRSSNNSVVSADPLTRGISANQRIFIDQESEEEKNRNSDSSDTDSEFFSSSRPVKKHKIIELSSQSDSDSVVLVGSRSSHKRKEKMNVLSDGSDTENRHDSSFSEKGKGPISSTRKRVIKRRLTNNILSSSLVESGESPSEISFHPTAQLLSSDNRDPYEECDASTLPHLSHPSQEDISIVSANDTNGANSHNKTLRKRPPQRQIQAKKKARTASRRRKKTAEDKMTIAMKKVTADARRVSSLIGNRAPSKKRKRKRIRKRRTRRRQQSRSSGGGAGQAPRSRSRARTAATHTPRRDPMREAVMESYKHSNKLEGLEWARAVLASANSSKRRGHRRSNIPAPSSGYVDRTSSEHGSFSRIERTYGFTPNRNDLISPSLVSNTMLASLFSNSKPQSSSDDNSLIVSKGGEIERRSLEIQRRLSKKGRCLSGVLVTPVKVPGGENETSDASGHVSTPECGKDDLLGKLCQGLDDLESGNNIIERDGTVVPIRNLDFSEKSSDDNGDAGVLCTTTTRSSSDSLTRQLFSVLRNDPLTSTFGGNELDSYSSTLVNGQSSRNSRLKCTDSNLVSNSSSPTHKKSTRMSSPMKKSLSFLSESSNRLKPASYSVQRSFSAQKSHATNTEPSKLIQTNSVDTGKSMIPSVINNSHLTELKSGPVSVNKCASSQNRKSVVEDREDSAVKYDHVEDVSLCTNLYSSRSKGTVDSLSNSLWNADKANPPSSGAGRVDGTKSVTDPLGRMDPPLHSTNRTRSAGMVDPPLHNTDRYNGTRSGGRVDPPLHNTDRYNGTRSGGRVDPPLHNTDRYNGTRSGGRVDPPLHNTDRYNGTRSGGRVDPPLHNTDRYNGTRSGGRVDPPLHNTDRYNGTRSGGRVDPPLHNTDRYNGTRSGGRVDPPLHNTDRYNGTRSGGRPLNNTDRYNGTRRSAGRADPLSLHTNNLCYGTRSSGRADPLSLDNSGNSTKGASKDNYSSLHDNHSTEPSNIMSADPKKIIRRALDYHFDNGEITNRQYKRILERASKKVIDGLSRQASMSEKRVTKLIADYVSAYSYKET